MTYEMYSPQTIEDAIETVRLINERFELDSGIVLFFRKGLEENLERPMTDQEWDGLALDMFQAAFAMAMDIISDLQMADEDGLLAAEDAAALAAEEQ